MERLIRRAQAVLGRACLGLGVAAAVVGCHQACKTCGGAGGIGAGIGGGGGIDNCANVPKGSIPQPIGTFTHTLFNTQMVRAEQDDFVIYFNEWLDRQAVLGPYGCDHIGRIIARLPTVPFPVIVQPEPYNPGLTAARQQAVIEMLTNAGIPNAAERVVVTRPLAEGQVPTGGGGGGGAGTGAVPGGPGPGGGFGGFGGVSGAFGFGGVPAFGFGGVTPIR